MSALRDRSQAIAFYYGNAARDLDDLLPPGDEPPLFPKHLSDEALAELEATEHRLENLDKVFELISQSEKHLNKILGAQRELRFLVKDLKRILS